MVISNPMHVPPARPTVVVAARIVLLLALAFASLADAQTFTVLHTFTGVRTGDGSHAMDGVILDRAGNVYGVTFSGGTKGDPGDVCNLPSDNGGCGTIFKLTRHGSNWIYSVLYKFQGPPDGNFPAGVVIGPDGALYGATQGGGVANDQICNDFLQGCGTVFRARPPATICGSVSCAWNETVLHAFTGTGGDGGNPGNGDLVFDAAGNGYGTTNVGGSADLGTVFKMSPAQGGNWTESIPYSFNSSAQGLASPVAGLLMDPAGNFYGTTDPTDGTPNGVTYQLVPGQSSWTANVLQSFVCVGGLNGCFPQAPIFDSAGNLLQATVGAGFYGMGTLIRLDAASDWNIDLLYTFTHGQGGVGSRLTMDAAGNLYGTGAYCGNGHGCVFKFTPSGSGYVYSEIYDFTQVGSGDGHNPMGPVVIDANGNIFGTTYSGGDNQRCLGSGDNGCGTVWEITP